MTPWNILTSAGAFIDFMNGYTIWLAPIAGILIADYWIVHQGAISIPDMYLPNGIYRYNRYGTNWRAAVAFFVGFVPLLPGFAQSVCPRYCHSCNWILMYCNRSMPGSPSQLARNISTISDTSMVSSLQLHCMFCSAGVSQLGKPWFIRGNFEKVTRNSCKLVLHGFSF